MTLQTGKLRRKLIIQQRAVGVNAANQAVGTWQPYLEVWAQPMTASGMAAIRAQDQSVNAVPTKYSWRLRYKRPGVITTDMRAVDKENGMVFDIRDIRYDLADRNYMDLVCETGGNNG